MLAGGTPAGDEVIRLNPEDADACCNRGVVYEQLGRFRGAEWDFREAEKLGFD